MILCVLLSLLLGSCLGVKTASSNGGGVSNITDVHLIFMNHLDIGYHGCDVFCFFFFFFKQLFFCSGSMALILRLALQPTSSIDISPFIFLEQSTWRLSWRSAADPSA